MNLKGDASTKARIAKRMAAFSKSLRDESLEVATIPSKEPRSVLPERYVDFYQEAARKSYAADVLDVIVETLETEVKLQRRPNLKCRRCGGKAAECYPRHLEGKSCA